MPKGASNDDNSYQPAIIGNLTEGVIVIDGEPQVEQI